MRRLGGCEPDNSPGRLVRGALSAQHIRMSVGSLDMFNKMAFAACVGFWLLTPATADALTLLSQKSFAAPAAVENVKVVCDEQGRCYRPPGRRPVAKWIYSDTNFYGPYTGPGYYGSPRYRYN